ncbi:hypothetical protein CO180_02570 [candidate division WWE3 bacterium CG_4_9_14_3_um_filter_41_6]|uniref:Uncharacterized protein n=1 Tax=candidate division WWE3 bacterium CG_4_10_14_0_2_um_filter_41_14 TaxID=1975072 RepID=A0A2M7TJ53_UNCKA|nr:MAG: hypothetical protein COY32_03195 [candidate division WWE3 bacterium CG_4_10_14_0_2_um_filter_41_14]PJA38766.1 MAG: hypothetical protein CO180_02570 [candidate division WWE3 bacterium CG_4_9_14_3_um_filter_41_6]
MIEYEVYPGFRPTQKNNIFLHSCKTPHEASVAAFLTLAPFLSRDTVLFCSRSDYLHELYELIVEFEPMPPSAMVMFEEVLGEPFHRASYERIYQERGFIDKVGRRGIPFYRILSRSPTLRGTVRAFNSRVEELLMTYTRRHVFLELLADGGLGGIHPGYKDSYECDGDVMEEYVVGVRTPGEDGKRQVSISFRALSYASYVWVFAFGERVEKALNSFLQNSRRPIEKFPFAFLHQLDKEVHIFTDRRIR